MRRDTTETTVESCWTHLWPDRVFDADDVKAGETSDDGFFVLPVGLGFHLDFVWTVRFSAHVILICDTYSPEPVGGHRLNHIFDQLLLLFFGEPEQLSIFAVDERTLLHHYLRRALNIRSKGFAQNTQSFGLGLHLNGDESG